MPKRTFKPGEIATTSGQYKNLTTGLEVTVTKGEHLPPTPKKRQEYRLTDRTQHKRRY